MRAVAQQLLAFAQRFSSERDIAAFQSVQPAQDPAGAAGSAGGKVVLFHEKGAFAGARALARDGDTHNAAADDGDLKVLAGERRPVGAG